MGRRYDSVVSPYRRAVALAGVFTAIALIAACEDSSRPGQPLPATGGAPPPQVSRLAWFQSASSATIVQSYTFSLFVDGTRMALSGATCSNGPTSTDFECSGPVPALAPGRRVLEVSAADRATGLESPRSSPLAVDVGSDGRPRPLASQEDGAAVATDAVTAVTVPSVACTSPEECFSVSLVATHLVPVRRLLSFADGRVLLLGERGTITILPSGVPEQVAFRTERAESNVTLADVGADPDFGSNRFLYFATTRRDLEGRRTVSVVRVREVAEHVGEAATIVADLPAAQTGDPSIAIGPDGSIYLAMPGERDGGAGYAGYILRFTADGHAAGNDRNGSPILAEGPAQPARLLWDAWSRLLVGAAESGAGASLAALPGRAASASWPATPVPVAGIAAPDGLTDLAAAPALGGSAHVAALARSGNDGAVLTLAGGTASNTGENAPPRRLPLGSLRPSAITYAGNGDLLVAARNDMTPWAILVRLRRISPQRLR
jgi:hypothetical protein